MKAIGSAFIVLAFIAQVRASELFIMIYPAGNYEVKVGNEVQINATGKFRFFNLEPGLVSVYVKEKSSIRTFYSGSVHLLSNRRVVVEIGNGKLQTLEDSFIPNDTDFPDRKKYDASHGHREACSDSDFAALMEILKKEGIDSSIITKAKEGMTKFNLSSEQVKQICGLLIFDSNKLEFAKYAYNFVVDPGEYGVVLESFTFSTSKDELERYIKNR